MIIAIPLTATAQKRKVVIPPKTGPGIATREAANLAKMPMIIKNMAQQYPAFRLAQRVRAMTPLFWAKVDMGVMVQRAARRPLNPSARIPP